MRFIFLVGVALYACFIVAWQIAKAQGDISAPVLADLIIEPSHVHTNSAFRTITMTARITDDLSGFHDAFIIFVPEVGTTQSIAAYFGHTWDSDVDEGLLSAIYTDTLILPRFAAEGWWKVQQLSLEDMVGNRKDYLVGSSDGFPQYLESYRFYNGARTSEAQLYIPSISNQ